MRILRPIELSDGITLTKSALSVLRYYLQLERESFCRSLKTIANEAGVSVRTVSSTNALLGDLGLLSWHSGNSRPQANQYKIDMKKARYLAKLPT